MHAVFFGIKRAHLQVLHVSRWLLKGMGLTPARFDMMRIVELHGRHGVAQSRIQDLLGVSAATVSRMLQSLEGLRLVMRERMDHDARQRRVHLTNRGWERVQNALFALIDWGVADRTALGALHKDPEKARPRLEVLRAFLWCLRKSFFDRAPFEDPWTDLPIAPYVTDYYAPFQ